MIQVKYVGPVNLILLAVYDSALCTHSARNLLAKTRIHDEVSSSNWNDNSTIHFERLRI